MAAVWLSYPFLFFPVISTFYILYFLNSAQEYKKIILSSEGGWYNVHSRMSSLMSNSDAHANYLSDIEQITIANNL